MGRLFGELNYGVEAPPAPELDSLVPDGRPSAPPATQPQPVGRPAKPGEPFATQKWCVDALLLRQMKVLPAGVLTAFRLLTPTGAQQAMPTVLPESLLELLPPPAADPGGSEGNSQASVLISATERLLRTLPAAVAGLGASRSALAALKQHLNASPADIARLVLSRGANPRGPEETCCNPLKTLREPPAFGA